jgi:tetratricopeptide (TPR) repeat protein
MGISSAAISGLAGSPAQASVQRLAGTKYVPNVSFICAYLTKTALEKVGLLDEKFTGYGFEDNDFCYRAAKAKLVSAVYDGCLVVHDRQEASSFRSRSDWHELMAVNRALFEQKWGKNVLAPAPVPEVGSGTPQELFDREEYDAALPHFVTASRTVENPIDRSQAMLMAARCHASLGRWDVAETWFAAAKKLAPDRREIPFFRGVALVKLRDLEEAAEAFKECLAIPASKRPFSAFDMIEVWDGTRPEEGVAFCAQEIARAKQEAAKGRA